MRMQRKLATNSSSRLSVKKTQRRLKITILTVIVLLIHMPVKPIQAQTPGLDGKGSTLFSQEGDVPGEPEAGDSMGKTIASGNFNGDNYIDLAVGIPWEAIGDISGAGAVIILYGSANGLSAQGSTLFSQESGDVPGRAEIDDRMGAALAAGNFNGDRYIDLAVGVSREDIGDISDAGAVIILYGSANGLSAQGSVLFSQETGDVPGTAQAGDHMGAALTAGNFNGDRYVDLAVGVPREDIGNISNAGAVNILYGSANGLSAQGSALFSQDDVAGKAEISDSMGAALAAGNFNGDRYVDLAVGVPGEDIGDVTGAGAVNILYGSANGLSAQGSAIFSQDPDDVPGNPEMDDNMGAALAAGNFNGDNYEDLAIGVGNEDINSTPNAGAVIILPGSANGLSAQGSALFSQETGNVPGTPEKNDYTGDALAAGDFNNDNYTDLAVGADGEAIGDISGAGAVIILYGSVNGLSDQGSELFSQDPEDVPGKPETYDLMGDALVSGDFNGDNYVDLSVGIYGEDIGGVPDAGAVIILYAYAPPDLVISSTTLNFNANKGQSSPPDQTFAITNTGTDTLNWTASESIPWLNLSATSGTTPSTVTVAIDSSGLTEGNYTGEIQITAGNQTETITVSLNVAPNTTPVNHQLYLPLVTR